MTGYTEGFSHFVTSMTAPVASGWSVSPGGTCTHWKAPPSHGAHVKRTLEIPVTLSENGKSKRVSTQEALMLRLREKALKGDARALEALLSLARTHNEDLVGHNEDTSLAAEDQAILDAYHDDVLARRSQSHGGGATTAADDHKGEEEGQ